MQIFFRTLGEYVQREHMNSSNRTAAERIQIWSDHNLTFTIQQWSLLMAEHTLKALMSAGILYSCSELWHITHGIIALFDKK